MSLIDKAIAQLSPAWGLKRAQARRAFQAVAHYDAASYANRMNSLRSTRSDSDTATARRALLAGYSRDMVRNTPFATRAQAVIAGSVVGDGIIPRVRIAPGTDAGVARSVKDRALWWIERHLDTTAIDKRGRQNLYGLQQLIMNAVVDAGECLVLLHATAPTPSSLPLQLEVLEIDHLDDTRVGHGQQGGEIRDGIEYDDQGERVAYWLFDEHPGSHHRAGRHTYTSRRVPADRVLHIYRVDRPGQQRGVTWFAPVMMRMQDLADHEDAQLMRQKIAACFAVFRTNSGGSVGESEGDKADFPTSIRPGAVYDMGDAETVSFASPPGVESYDEFTRSVLRSIAAGMGLTYEALTGDLSNVNFSSARMGRVEMDQNISAWQHLMLIPQLLQPLGHHLLNAWQAVDERHVSMISAGERIWQDISVDWVPPRRVIVDPSREFAALATAVKEGFLSRQHVVRQLGTDPERLNEEILEDIAFSRAHALTFGAEQSAPDPGSGRLSNATHPLEPGPDKEDPKDE